MCIDVFNHPVVACGAPDIVSCECQSCGLGVCFDGLGNFADCVCAVCATDPFCTDPANCTDDGICDPYLEGCHCTDCADHVFCATQTCEGQCGVFTAGNPCQCDSLCFMFGDCCSDLCPMCDGQGGIVCP